MAVLMWSCLPLLLALLISIVKRACNRLRLWRICRLLNQQGIRGPVPQFLGGNFVELHKLRSAKAENAMEGISHDIVAHVTPEVDLWSAQYGKPYLFSSVLGEPTITIFDPELCKTILSSQSVVFPKSAKQVDLAAKFIGEGLSALNGEEWSQHRRILLPAFHVLKLKEMVPTFQECVQRLVDEWSQRVSEGEAEIEITNDLAKFAADAISHTAFSSSYEKGQRVFELLSFLSTEMIKLFQWSWMPCFSYLPMPVNFRIWKLEREIDNILLNLIRERRNMHKSETKAAPDLLDLIIQEGSSNENNKAFSDRKIVGECKNFYRAGHEATASLLSWTLFLLAINPEWQDRARAEVQEHWNGSEHPGEVVGKLKVVGMILHETLRLYPPAGEILRMAEEDTVFINSGLRVPKGTAVLISILSVHHDKELWGEDVNEFKPERFALGASKSNAFIPFGFGPRVCIGQSFVLMEAKIALAALLRNLSFKLAPGYRHNPVTRMFLIPAHGIQLQVERL